VALRKLPLMAQNLARYDYVVYLVADCFHCRMIMIAMKNVYGENATATSKRSDFGADKYVPTLADAVNIALQIEAIKD
jgi:polyisoprenoid-binding protein YceI